MKKLFLILGAVIACVACQSEMMQKKTLAEFWSEGRSQNAPENTYTAQPQVAAQPAEQQAVPDAGYVVTPQSAQNVRYQPDVERIRRNIIVKATGEDYVVYEYGNIRIDEVATLASAYCYENSPGKKAYLRDIYMNKNHKRRATFDCVNLASM